MKRLQKVSIIINLMNRLKEKGSWCGETHIQKSLYFLQELTKVPLEFEFILYKHGPFSFDLRDELTAMRADGLIENVVQPYPYGPSLNSTKSGNNIHEFFPITTEKYSDELSFIAKYLGDKTVAELERMGTALYISSQSDNENMNEKAEEIIRLKPHVNLVDARIAVQKVEEMKNNFQ